MKKLFLSLFLLPIFSFASEDIGILSSFQGKVLVNSKAAYKSQVLKDGDSIFVPSLGFASITYNSGTKEILRSSAILSKNKLEKYQKYQNTVEKVKTNLGGKGFEAIPKEKMTGYEKQVEELRTLYNNSEYDKLIKFIETSSMNINHPDNLFKVAIAYFRAGDISIAMKHLKKLKSYDIPEYEDHINALYVACLYLSNDEKTAKKEYGNLLNKQSENKLLEELKIFND